MDEALGFDHDQPPAVEVRRSARRTRTVSAYRSGDTIVVLMPARLTRAEEQKWVTTMVDKIQRQEQRRRDKGTDEALMKRSAELADRYLDGVRPASVRWVDNQLKRWGSCSTATGDIRLSSRLRHSPTWVIDAVLIHELAHLIHPDHGPGFKALVARYEYDDRAEAYLLGFADGARLEVDSDLD